jgi:nucleoside-diphosphate-sugar epimerase
MKALILGGTGVLSTDTVALALERGWEITVLNRALSGKRVPAGAQAVVCDAHDYAAMEQALEGQYYDCVVNFVGYLPETVEQDTRLFDGKCGQYIFISTCATYQKPDSQIFTTESTPLRNIHSPYGQRKIACEEVLNHAYRDRDFPITIIRPNWTYNIDTIPFVCTSWKKPWMLIDRMEKGLPIIIPGDGTNRFTITHAKDFAVGVVGLMGNRAALGHAFHITGDEALSWNQYLEEIEWATGLKANVVHIATDFICKVAPNLHADLAGDKTVNFLFDNTKIKRFVPDFCAKIPYAQGVKASIDHMRAHEELRVLDHEYIAMYEKILAAYSR